ncbi:MAG: DUF4474 domain-containing protein [Phaeodactylibacter sp.]|nr:DUF4474 domain-containing protein [Phaeodactylibacter sp.]
MGTNVPTNWYQKDIHESYVEKIFETISSEAQTGDEFIILGDLFDFWTYPPDKTPPTAQQIIDANPNILGPNGALVKLINQGKVKVSYLKGNHDITTSQDDLHLISDKIQLQSDIYISDGVGYTHGHIYTIFNAPDPNQPIPVGHYVTRAISYYLQQKHENAANEPGFGVPAVRTDVVENIMKDMLKSGNPEKISATTDFLEAIQKETGIPMDAKVVLPHNLGTKTYQQAIADYKDLWANWITTNNFINDSGRGFMTSYKSAYADIDGSYMGWFAQELAMHLNVDLVIMGHTHVPKLGLQDGIVNYMNTGFECVPVPDMSKQVITYGRITTTPGQAPKPELFSITKSNSSYTVKSDNPGPALLISEHSEGDYSCYITIENDSGEELEYVTAAADHGYFAVIPPKIIPTWQKGQLWLQDNPGLHGSEGSVTYKGQESGKSYQFNFECPTGIYSNKASGPGDFYTKSGSVSNNWGNEGHVQSSGHPFFVKYMIDYSTRSNWIPTSTLSKLVETAGFLYDPSQEIIYSRMNPIQRDFGYAYNYDKFATLMDFDIDCEPIFFDYAGKKWRIEFWKGQYGLETGCEIGIYNRDTSDHDLKYTLLDAALGEAGNPDQQYYYSCAGNEDLLQMSFTLKKNGQKLFSRGPEKHWWLTGFKWGVYSEPTELTMDIDITLKDAAMTARFVAALKQLQYNPAQNGNNVTFTFDRPKTQQPPKQNIDTVRKSNKDLVNAYQALKLKSNDPNQIADELDENMSDSVINYGEFFKRMIDVALLSIENWLTAISDLRNFKVMDFSTVVDFRNWSQDTMLLRGYAPAKSTFPPGQDCGTFMVKPARKILPGDNGRLLIQDNFGAHGGEGWVAYDIMKPDGTRQTVNFSFGCPTGVYDNYVRIQSDQPLPPNFINYVAVSGDTKTFDGAKPNEIPDHGHPLHIRITVGTEAPKPNPVPTPAKPIEISGPPTFVSAWGSQGSAPGQFNNPQDIAVDSQCNVYVTDSSNNRVQKFDANGNFLKEWNSGLQSPWGIVTDNQDNIYVANPGEHNILKFSSEGQLLLTISGEGDGNGQFGAGRPSGPMGITVDKNGNIYAVDPSLTRVQKFDPSGNFLLTWNLPDYTTGANGITVDDNLIVYVGDFYGSIHKFSDTGNFLGGNFPDSKGSGGLRMVENKYLFVANNLDQCIQVFSPDGQLITKWGSRGSGEGQFNYPWGIAVDKQGFAYTAGQNNPRVQKFSFSG